MKVVSALMRTGAAKVAVCQPVAVSLVKVTVPSNVPVSLQSDPVCVPVLRLPL